jgi:hypothetical protein
LITSEEVDYEESSILRTDQTGQTLLRNTAINSLTSEEKLTEEMILKRMEELKRSEKKRMLMNSIQLAASQGLFEDEDENDEQYDPEKDKEEEEEGKEEEEETEEKEEEEHNEVTALSQ